jgi:hypothetical protein
MSWPAGSDQRLGCEIAFRQSIHETLVPDVLEAVGGRRLDQEARGAIRARPYHARVGRNIARLYAVRDHRPLGQRLNAGAATLPKAAAVAAEAKDVRNRRRVVTLPARGRPDMNLSPPNHRGGWLRFLTVKKSKTTGV